MRRAVIAVGGNALVMDNRHSTIAHQRESARALARTLLGVLAQGWEVVVTHGNGPQVGFILQRSELATAADAHSGIPAIGLDLAVADSQGGIGHLLASSLLGALSTAGQREQVAALLTHTVVDPADPAFARPTKPIGTWYSAEHAAYLVREAGWKMSEEPGRGWRRLVASPYPVRILETSAIATLVDSGFVVIAGGGGGIPVVEDPQCGYRGVEAVIDKDHASAMLAGALGANLLLLTTGVERVALDFGQPSQRSVDCLTLTEAEQHMREGQFPEGTMGPKISACISFLRGGGREALITCPDRIEDALRGRAGTRIVQAVA
ncbi:MAG: carbamate kinase [Acidimicrobiales bacterium]